MQKESRSATCSNCVWYDQYHHELGNEKGYCRLNPPRVILESGTRTVWPTVYPYEFCGKLRPKLPCDERRADGHRHGCSYPDGACNCPFDGRHKEF